MPIVGILINLVLFIIVLMYANQKQYKKLFMLVILSTLGDIFGLRFIGPAVRLSHIIGLATLPRTLPYYYKNIKKREWHCVNLLFLEFIILFLNGMYFGFINPWHDINYFRPWNQAAQGRTVITWFKFISDYSIVLFVIYVTSRNIINYKDLVKSIVPISTYSLIFSILSYLSPVNFVHLIFGLRDLEGRFYGWFGEPKEFGKTATISLAILILAKIYRLHSSKYLNYGIIITSTIIILSASTSTLVLVMIFLFLLFVGREGNVINNIFLKYYIQFFIFIGAIIVIYTFFTKTEIYEEHYKVKIEKILYSDLEDRLDDIEPKLFTKFEIWDRVAANMLYRNIKYIFIGVGPNLIHIPATKYKSEKHLRSWKGALNSVPKMGWLNIISRSGFLGLLLWIMSYFDAREKIKISGNKVFPILLLIVYIYYFLTIAQWFFVILGFIVGSVMQRHSDEGVVNVKYNYTSAKRSKFY